MKLLPAGVAACSDWDDGLWAEKPGHPIVDCTWIHPPPKGHSLPEFEFEEGHDKNRNDPCPTFLIGSGQNCHIRIDHDALPERVCRVAKEGRTWLLERLSPAAIVHLGAKPLAVGQRVQLNNNDVFSLAVPPTPFTYRAFINDEDNWYIDEANERDYPNKYPGRFPGKSSSCETPEAPEELKRLAWQTDQMRRRSEEDQVRVADWSHFSQHVKRHYYEHGITCISWAEKGRNSPIDMKSKSYSPRKYPAWICDLLVQECQQPGMEADRQLPFASSLRISGFEPRQPMVYTGAQPLPNMKLTGSQSMPLVLPNEPSARVADLRTKVHLKQSFRDWLQSMDDSSFLLQYHDTIAANFDSLEQVYEIYVRNSELQTMFFDDVGIKKLGHRRIIEKWFREHCLDGLNQ